MAENIFVNPEKRTAPTKIVATLGPATGSKEMVRRLIERGVDMFRINFSHGTHDGNGRVLDAVRAAERELGVDVAVLADLCGPKIRTGVVKDIIEGGMELKEGQELIVQREDVIGHVVGETSVISTIYPLVIDMAQDGQRILLDDGKMQIRVAKKEKDRLICRIEVGGILKSHKGMNLPDTDLGSSSLTDKDKVDAAYIVTRPFDYVALSFVSNAGSVRELRALLDTYDSQLYIVAKIEKPSALENIEEIVDVSDAVMVARGDLGVEMSLHSVPPAQKRITNICHSKFKPCIIATQMLETMIENAVPTRAEVSDVANAVLDSADAVMLSGETAVGKHPLEAVSLIDKITVEIKPLHDEMIRKAPPPTIPGDSPAMSMALAIHGIVSRGDISAVAIYTVTGETARFFSKMRFPCPVIGITNSARIARRMQLFFGVITNVYKGHPTHTREVVGAASKIAQELGLAKKADHIVVCSSRPLYQAGCANTLVLHEIGTEQ